MPSAKTQGADRCLLTKASPGPCATIITPESTAKKPPSSPALQPKAASACTGKPEKKTLNPRNKANVPASASSTGRLRHSERETGIGALSQRTSCWWRLDSTAV